ncbi:hypothetical protein Acr_05g0007510 [Actinidia rufa]|uniref:Uncharacterized protein n=1 Tax=Actinidia rufa TaxID=165716 RepID=A0A7J0ELD3_9ERIC|nr:hypothetical protein Acr_05g0007510 [Actinidia rufa]
MSTPTTALNGAKLKQPSNSTSPQTLPPEPSGSRLTWKGDRGEDKAEEAIDEPPERGMGGTWKRVKCYRICTAHCILLGKKWKATNDIWMNRRVVPTEEGRVGNFDVGNLYAPSSKWRIFPARSTAKSPSTGSATPWPFHWHGVGQVFGRAELKLE